MIARVRRLGVALAAVALLGAGGGAGARLVDLEPVKILSGSMAPTVETGDWVLVHAGRKPERGDIIMFRFPLGTSGRAIKRVVAVAGDRVSYSDHSITVNGRTHAIGSPRPGLGGSLVVPRGTVFVLGDHSEVSIDSRSFGALPVTEALGKVIVASP